MDRDMVRREELAAFLRSRRARLMPEERGLPRRARRRTPGLRREDVAELAGIGTTWYTRLEQGLDIRPSAGALEGIAEALELDEHERDHLFRLALQHGPSANLSPDDAIPPRVLRVVSEMPSPVFVINYRWDLLAWNRLAQIVFLDFDALPPQDRHLLTIVLTHPEVRTRLVDWEEFAQGMLALFRTVWGRYPGDEALTQRIHALERSSPEFRAWWPKYELRGHPESRKVVAHPTIGELTFEPSTFLVDGSADMRMVVYTPAPGTNTACLLDRISSQSRRSSRPV